MVIWPKAGQDGRGEIAHGMAVGKQRHSREVPGRRHKLPDQAHNDSHLLTRPHLPMTSQLQCAITQSPFRYPTYDCLKL